MDNGKKIKIICEPWTFFVDVDKMRRFYDSWEPRDSNSQIYRNYASYFNNLNSDEKEFFDAFCIDVLKPFTNAADFFDRRKKHYFGFGSYIVFGEIVDGPADSEMWIPIEEFLEEHEEEDDRDFSLDLGRFEFNVENPKSEFYEGPENLPEGAFALNFSIEEIPWLLDEAVTEIDFEWAHWWDIPNRIADWKKKSNLVKEGAEEFDEMLEELFRKPGIELTQLNKKEGERIIDDWIENTIISKDEIKKARKLCLGKGNCLWHLFSFEFADCLCRDDAMRSFAKKTTGPAWLILEAYLGYSVYSLDEISKLDKKAFNEAFKGDDLILTAKDFSWTFSRTHEEVDFDDEYGPFWSSPV